VSFNHSKNESLCIYNNNCFQIYDYQSHAQSSREGLNRESLYEFKMYMWDERSNQKFIY